MRRLGLMLTAATLLSGAAVASAPTSAASVSGSSLCWYHLTAWTPVNLWVRRGPGPGYEHVDYLPWARNVRGRCSAAGAWVKLQGVDGCWGWSYRPFLAQGATSRRANCDRACRHNSRTHAYRVGKAPGETVG